MHHTDARLQEPQTAFDEPLVQRSLAIREAALGPHHPDVAASLDTLAILYTEQGLYSRAEPLFQRALAIREAALGPHHPDVAASLNGLAILYREQGLYSRAEPLFLRALAIREAALGPHHSDVAASLNGLADLYSDQGLYGRAEPLFQRALEIREAAFGTHHPLVARSLYNLATLYSDQGLSGRAEPLFQQALAIQERTLGKNHPLVADSLDSLAHIYREQGLYSRAEPLFQRSLAIHEAVSGEHPSRVAYSLHNLANLYSEQGLYGRAEPLYQRSLAIREAALGPHHPDVAASLNSLAILYREQGLYGRAELLFQRALAILENTFGRHNPLVAPTLNNLARLHLSQHRLANALPLLTRAFALSEQRLRQEALDFSESRLADFLQHLRTEEELLYALLRAHPGNPHVQRLALSAVLLRKGRSVEETANTSRTILRGLGPQDRESFERLRALRTQLAALSLRGTGSLSPADYQKRIEDLVGQGDALEADLARRSAPLRALSARPTPEEIVDGVAAALPRDGALVEFVAYSDQPLTSKPGTPKPGLPSQPHYLALILFADARIHVVDLGPAAAIDHAAANLRDAFAERDATYLSASQALHALAFEPLRPVLGTTRRLFLAPDGQLSLVPFAALHDGNSFLIDSFDFSYLTSGKDLLPRAQEHASSDAIVVLADPAFRAPPATAPSQEPAPPQRAPSLERFFSTLWQPLPGTRQEAKAIQRLLPQAQLFLGIHATRQRLLQLPAPAVLHIATHGFFLEDASTSTGSRALAHVGASAGSPPEQPPPDPLLRSGLVLTSAPSQEPSAPENNSLVTALELASLDLWGTQLVVLSACDTGRGHVKLGQGVYGLRRSLAIAGAETVVMSLWKINDDSTRLLMTSYYRHLLAGMGRAAALHQAMRSLRQSHPHPHYWAPFIALGSDAPLRARAPRPLHPTASTGGPPAQHLGDVGVRGR